MAKNSKVTKPAEATPSLVVTDEQKQMLVEAHLAMQLYGAHPAIQTAVKTEVEKMFRKLGHNALADEWNKVVWS